MCLVELTLLILSLPLCNVSSATEPRLDFFKETENVYDRIYDELKNKYDRRIRPFIGVKPVEVEVFLYISSLRSISEATMDYKLELYFREYWQDPRMSYNPRLYNNMSRISLHESYADLIWVPDTFLPNAVHSENPDSRSITHRALLRLEPDGHLLYSRRLSVTAECPMDLSLYPFDQQMCRLSIESYGYGTDDIVYKWVDQEPIVLNPSLKLPDFKIKAVITKSHNVTLATGTYSRLEACFFFVRSSAFYFVQLFIPATAIVVTSWLSLWMEGESTFSDMVEVILAITFLYYSYNTMMPRVSYIKAMDIYLGACFIFVFLSLIKLAILKLLRLHGDRREWRNLRRGNFRRFFRAMSTCDCDCDQSNHVEKHQDNVKAPWLNHNSNELENSADDENDDSVSTTSKISQIRNRVPPSSFDFAPTTVAPSTDVANHRNNVVQKSARLPKTASRTALLYSTLSLDATERYKKPGLSIKRACKVQGSNGVMKRGFFKSSSFGNFFRTRTNNCAKCRPANSRYVRFRKTYKRISVVLFPVSFFGFCIYYFCAYFMLSEDISITKCQF